MGQSGSGKTTLLNLIGGLDMPEQGEILVEEHVLGGDIPLEKYRQNYVGFVFQEYNLLENLSVYENIAIAVSSCTKRELNEKIVKVLKEVDLSGYENRKMNELSGGQKQRVAIARALAKNTSILLCDEPTGNLDSHTSKEIFDLLKKISLEKTIGLVVGHNQGVYSDCSTNMGYNISYYYWHFIGWYDQSDRCFKVDEGKVGYQE